MRLYACRSGGESIPGVVIDPFLGGDPFVEIPWFFYAIAHPRGIVLFDAGIHPALIADPGSRVGDWADRMSMHATPADSATAQLAAVGITPEDVGTIVMSHLHFDHASALELFPGADVYVQRAELGFAADPPAYQVGPYRPGDWAHGPRWHVVDGYHDLFGDDLVTLVPLPGHTPGHQGLLVRCAERPVLLIGDAAYRLGMVRERRLSGVLWNPDAVLASYSLIEYLERREGALVLCSHEDPQVSQVRIAPDAWYE